MATGSCSLEKVIVINADTAREKH